METNVRGRPISCPLIIFEGVDGAGKTTIAREVADAMGAKYVHFPALRNVGYSLPRLYVEAMLPAVMGYQPVVFDRSWLSEGPYGTVYRDGLDRVTPYNRAMIERLALRCGASVVLCDPGIESVEESWKARQKNEMLRDIDQVRRVHSIYGQLKATTSLPVVDFNYRIHTFDRIQTNIGIDGLHALQYRSAGNLSATIALVGDEFAERKDQDPWLQWPFASFSNGGCSRWLTMKLLEAGVSEYNLLWLNKDDVELLHDTQTEHVLALGQEAAAELYRHKITAEQYDHPQYWKRFHTHRPYPLIERIKELLS